jgi:hypothetical protein
MNYRRVGLIYVHSRFRPVDNEVTAAHAANSVKYIEFRTNVYNIINRFSKSTFVGPRYRE